METEFTKSNCEFMSEDITLLLGAFLRASEEFTATGKSGNTPRFAYAKGEDISSAVIPALRKYGIAIWHHEDVTQIDDPMQRRVLITRMIHSSGQWRQDRRFITSEAPGNQAAGGALTYSRKNAVLNLCGIYQEDDDCELEQQHINEKLKLDTLTKDQYKKLAEHLASFSNAQWMVKNIYEFNKVSKIDQLPQSKYLSVMKYIDENGKR